MSASAPSKPKQLNPQAAEVVKLKKELDEAKAELERARLFFDQVETFSTLIKSAKADLKELYAEEFDLKQSLKVVREEIKSQTNLIESSNSGMLAVLEPGPSEFMPLFDQMDKTDTAKHGKNAQEFREQPISVLRLSPLASTSLIDSDVVFIGQLQDLILADPDSWWVTIENLTEAVAAAVADKLAEFVRRGGE